MGWHSSPSDGRNLMEFNDMTFGAILILTIVSCIKLFTTTTTITTTLGANLLFHCNRLFG